MVLTISLFIAELTSQVSYGRCSRRCAAPTRAGPWCWSRRKLTWRLATGSVEDDVVTLVQHRLAKAAELIAERRPDVAVFRQGVFA